MISFLYTSKTRCALDLSNIVNLITAAAKSNQSADITGFIWYEAPYFVQYIEGGEKQVSDLMLRIENDPRHIITTRYIDCDLQSKRFPDWSMRSINDESIEEFDPQKLLCKQMLLLQDSSLGVSSITKSVWRQVDHLAYTYRRQLAFSQDMLNYG